MTLPTTGPISMSMVAAELGISSAGLSLNDSRVRALAGKPTGAIGFADLRGKSADAGSISMTAGQSVIGADTLTGYFSAGFRSGSPVIGSITSTTISPGVTVYAVGRVSTMGNIIDFVGNVASTVLGKTLMVGSTATTIETANFDGDYTRCFLSVSSSALFVASSTYSLTLS